RQYTPKKIFIEMNGMWDYKWVFEWGQMDRLVLAQVITLVDGITFPVYLNNMRSLFSNMFQYTEMVIFNRCDDSMDLHSYRRTVRSLNPRAMVYFEGEDGEP
ncbi:GTPase, partial [Lacrimispora saccharolytica]|nr:GTPase [Lacrimispora saccharolytica]